MELPTSILTARLILSLNAGCGEEERPGSGEFGLCWTSIETNAKLILLQDFPDPDALSSAWTFKLIASTYDIECDIFYAAP